MEGMQDSGGQRTDRLLKPFDSFLRVLLKGLFFLVIRFEGTFVHVLFVIG